MKHKHRSTLQALFAHPVSANIEPRLVYALIEDLGGEVTHGGHGQIKVTLKGHTHGFHDVQHSFSKEDVVQIRKFLEAAGIDAAHDFASSSSVA
jgi:hypothetical protein